MENQSLLEENRNINKNRMICIYIILLILRFIIFALITFIAIIFIYGAIQSITTY